jgi:hypothetical protein
MVNVWRRKLEINALLGNVTTERQRGIIVQALLERSQSLVNQGLNEQVKGVDHFLVSPVVDGY